MEFSQSGSFGGQTPSITTGKGFGIRALAYIIDAVVMGVINFILGFIVGAIIGIAMVAANMEPVYNDIPLLSMLFGIVYMTIYFTLFEGLFGATPGKLVTSMRVVKEDGTACGISPAFIRALLRLIDGLFFGLIAYAKMKGTSLQQRIGDNAAKTIVVGANDPGIRERPEITRFVIAAVGYLVLAGILAVFQILMATL